MTNYNVTIKEITSTTAGQGFTIGQGGVISILHWQVVSKVNYQPAIFT